MEARNEAKETSLIFSGKNRISGYFSKLILRTPDRDDGKWPIIIRESIGDVANAFSITNKYFDEEIGEIVADSSRFYFVNGEWVQVLPNEQGNITKPENAMSIQEAKDAGKDPGKLFCDFILNLFPPEDFYFLQPNPAEESQNYIGLQDGMKKLIRSYDVVGPSHYLLPKGIVGPQYQLVDVAVPPVAPVIPVVAPVIPVATPVIPVASVASVAEKKSDSIISPRIQEIADRAHANVERMAREAHEEVQADAKSVEALIKQWQNKATAAVKRDLAETSEPRISYQPK